jgi:hypothetical protein
VDPKRLSRHAQKILQAARIIELKEKAGIAEEDV